MAGTQGHTFMVKAGGRAWWPEAGFPNVTPPLLPSFRSSVLTQWTNEASFAITAPPPILSGRREKNRKSKVA